MEWTVEGFIPNKSLGSLYGEPESFKSLLAVHLGCCVATGDDFFGHKVRQGVVLYIAPEGGTGLPSRIEAWKNRNGWAGCYVPFFTKSSSFDLTSEDDREMLSNELLKRKEWQPRLIIIDTLGQSLGNADENSASDINKIARFINDLKVTHDCAFLWVDHSGHSKDRARGTSAKRAALDVEFHIKRSGNAVSINNTKMKDAPRTARLKVNTVIDELGIGLIEAEQEPTNTDLLQNIIETEGLSEVEEIKECFYKKTPSASKEAKRKAFNRSKQNLIENGLIEEVETKLVLKTLTGHDPPLSLERGLCPEVSEALTFGV